MGLAVFLARTGLALIFTVAAVTKIINLERFGETVLKFGIPNWASGTIKFGLPLVELIVALALLSTRWARSGAIGALVLLAAFMLAITINLAQGKKPDCQCFGQLHSTPVGPWTLMRNGVLLSVAGFVLWQSGRPGVTLLDIAATLESHGVALLIGGVVVFVLVLQSWLILHLFRQSGRILLRIEALEGHQRSPARDAQSRAGLKIGTKAPKFDLPSASGGLISLDRLLALGKPTLLIFSDANCGPCKALLPEVARWQTAFASQMTITLVSRGKNNDKIAVKHKLDNVLVQKEHEVAEQYNAFGTPTAVLVWTNGMIASGLASGAAQILDLVNAIASGKLHMAWQRATMKIGDAAPGFSLRDLNEAAFKTSDLRGSKTMLLFWNPSCGFCQRMLGDLRDWDLALRRGVSCVRFVVVATGTAEQNRAMNLSSPVLSDKANTVSNLFGASGTPSAMLLDEQGRVASSLAVGAKAILELRDATAKVLAKSHQMVLSPATASQN